MSVSLWDLLEWAGYIADTPGALTRGALAGRPGERVAGREMLEDWGLLGSNQEGIDAGDVAGFGADMLLDPLNLLGGAGLWKGLGKVDDVARANKQAQRLLDMGAMPEDVARATRLVDDVGTPRRLYHGTAAPEFGPREFAPDPGSGNWMGKGTYFTDDPAKTSGYQKFDKSGTILPPAREEVVGRTLKAVEEAADLWAVPLDEIAPYDLDKWIEELVQAGDIDIPDLFSQNFMEYLVRSRTKSNVGISPGDYETIGKLGVDFYEDLFGRINAGGRPSAPRTMMSYVDSRNPFDLDAPISMAETGPITENLGNINSGSWDYFTKHGTDKERLLSRIKNDIAGYANKKGGELTSGDVWALLQDKAGLTPDEVTDLLRTSGYDAITHGPGTADAIGGMVNIDPYSEIVPFDPSQIYAPYIAPNQQARPIGDILAALLMGGHNTIARSQSGVQ